MPPDSRYLDPHYRSAYSRPSLALLYIANRLPSGNAVDIPTRLIQEATKEDDPATASFRMGVPHPEDVQAFIKKISANWDIKIDYNGVHNLYTMSNPLHTPIPPTMRINPPESAELFE